MNFGTRLLLPTKIKHATQRNTPSRFSLIRRTNDQKLWSFYTRVKRWYLFHDFKHGNSYIQSWWL